MVVFPYAPERISMGAHNSKDDGDISFSVLTRVVQFAQRQNRLLSSTRKTKLPPPVSSNFTTQPIADGVPSRSPTSIRFLRQLERAKHWTS